MADEPGPNAAQHNEAAAAWFRKDLERVNADLLAVLQKYWPAVGSQLIAHALIETTGDICAAIAATDPDVKRAIVAKLADLKLFVETTDQAPQ